MEKSTNVIKFAEARASEISSLIEEVNNVKGKTAFQRLPPHLRRRAASHNHKRVPRKLRESYLVQNPHAQSKPKKPPRKVHRHQQRKKHKKQVKNYPEEYASRSKSKAIWLETHIWYSKRSKMETLWGYKLAMHRSDQKLGATHEALTNGAILEDLSYYCCIELKGPQKQLLDGLSNLVDPGAGSHFGSEVYVDGEIEGNTFIYKPKKFPFEAIGPVTFIWNFKSNITEDQHFSNDIRILWISCHPSFHDELVLTLVELFQLKENVSKMEDNLKNDALDKKQEEMFVSKVNFVKVKQHYKKNICYENDNVCMILLKNSLVRHRIIGPKAKNILTNVIELANVELNETDSCNNALKNSSHLEKSALEAKSDISIKRSLNSDDEKINLSKKLKLDSTIKSPLHLKSPDIAASNQVSYNNKDALTDEKNLKESDGNCETPINFQPLLNSYYKNEKIKHSHGEKKKLLEYLKNENSKFHIPPGLIISFTVRDPRLIMNQNKQDLIFKEDKYFADFTTNLKEHLSVAAMDSPIWNENIRNEVTATQVPEHVINKERSTFAISSESMNLKDKESRIPILLVHQPGNYGFGYGWDLIAPLGWSMAFWIPLILNGGMAAGLRDLNFINLEIGKPNFPLSFPDTKAGATFEEAQRLENLNTCYKRPKAKRPHFQHFGIPNPFFMPLEVLIEKCLIEHYNFLPNIPSDKKMSVSENAKLNFFVCRDDKIIWKFCELCDTVSKRSYICTSENSSRKQMFHEFMSLTLISLKQLFSALILITLKCINKGSPTKYSGIYALSYSDLQEIKKDCKFSGPIEPNHTNCNQCKQISEETSKSLADNKTHLKHTDRPLVKSLQTCSTRKMIGYLSEGGLSSIMGKGCATGHCSFVGLLDALMNCLNAGVGPLVLIRQQDSFYYRIMSFEVFKY